MKFTINNIDLEALINNMPDLICYVDTGYRFLSCNQSCKNFLDERVQPELIPGTDMLDFCAKENKYLLKHYFRQAKKHQVFSFETSFAVKGDLFYFDMTFYSLMNEQGEHMGYCILAKDITEKRTFRQALKKAEEKYRLLFEQNPMAIFVVGIDDLKIYEVNEKATYLYGYSKEELLGMTSLDLRKTEEHERIITFMQQLKRGESPSSKGVWRHVSKSGETLFVEISYHTIIYDHKKVALAMANDITQKVLLEEKLQQENQLKQQQITEAVISAQEKERAEIGRELHDNINQILGGTKLYIDVARKNEQKREELLRLSSEQLMHAIEEIRKLSRSMVNYSDCKPGLADALHKLTEDTRLVQSFIIELSLSAFDEQGMSESLKLNILRIIQEQLNNIIKHAAPKKVYISLERNTQETRLHISDDGCGFDLKKEKNGIGIANITSRAALYKGEINWFTKPGAGCTLKIVFPNIAAVPK